MRLRHENNNDYLRKSSIRAEMETNNIVVLEQIFAKLSAKFDPSSFLPAKILSELVSQGSLPRNFSSDLYLSSQAREEKLVPIR